MSVDSPVGDLERMPPIEGADLDRSDCLRLSMKRAFPLPSTGAFTDLLAAMDSGTAGVSQDRTAGNLPAKPSTSAER